MSLRSFLRQISDMLPLGQRRKVDQVHVLVGRRTRRQKSLCPVFVPLLFYGGDVVHLNTMSQISLAFFLPSPCLFLLLSSFLCRPCLFSCFPLCPLLLLFLPEPCLCLFPSFYELLLIPFIIKVGHSARVNGVVQHCG